MKIDLINIELNWAFEELKDIETDINYKSKLYFEYIKTLQMILYSIKSEITFPYLLN